MLRRLALGVALTGLACAQRDGTRESTVAGGNDASATAAAAPPEREGYAITPDSVRIWYRVVGTGPETVILNAANYHQKSFDSLVTSTRRVVLYDIRGRGKSDSVPPSKTGMVEFDAPDIEAVRLAVGADSVALIGWSGGALADFQYALRYPSRVTRVVFLAPVGPRWVPWWDDMRASSARRADTAAAAQLAARAKAGEFADDEAALCRAQAKLGLPASFGDTTRMHLAPDVCDSPNELPTRYGSYVGRLLGKLGKYDWRGDLAKVKVPVLLIHGELDNPPLAGSREWVAGFPDARLLVMRGVGHWPQYERPAEMLSAIRTFLEGGWPTGSETVRPTP